MIHLLATTPYVPFFNSVQAIWPEAGDYWLWAVIPLAFAISLVYKGTKVTHVRELPWAATKLTTIVLFVMTLTAGALYGLVYAVNHHWFG